MVSFGAILGSNIRFIIYEKFEKLHLSKDLSTLVINTFASFSLGLLISLMPRISSYDFSYQLVLFVSIGFLGSLSTFSAFVYDLFDAFLKINLFSALKLFFISLTLGIASMAFGFYLGNQ